MSNPFKQSPGHPRPRKAKGGILSLFSIGVGNSERQPATPQSEQNSEINNTRQSEGEDAFEERLNRAAATIAPSHDDEPLTENDRKKIEGLRRLVEKRRSESRGKSLTSPASKTGMFRRAETVMSPTTENTPKSANNARNKPFRKEVIIIEDTESEDVGENGSQDEVEGELGVDTENIKSIGANDKETFHDVIDLESHQVLEVNQREDRQDGDYEPDEDSQDTDSHARLHKRGHVQSNDSDSRRLTNRRKNTLQSSLPSHNTPKKTRKSTLQPSPSLTDPRPGSNTIRQSGASARNTSLTTTKSYSSLSAPSRKVTRLSKTSKSATQEELEEFDRQTFKISIRIPNSEGFDSLN